MDTLKPKQLERLREAAALLNRVSGKLPLLRSMDWDDSFRQRFLADGTLPTPVYHPWISNPPEKDSPVRVACSILPTERMAFVFSWQR